MSERSECERIFFLPPIYRPKWKDLEFILGISYHLKNKSKKTKTRSSSQHRKETTAENGRLKADRALRIHREKDLTWNNLIIKEEYDKRLNECVDAERWSSGQREGELKTNEKEKEKRTLKKNLPNITINVHVREGIHSHFEILSLAFLPRARRRLYVTCKTSL